METIGLIAGSDELPLVFAEEAVRDGKRVIAVAFSGYTSPEIDSNAKTYWLDSIDPAGVLEILKKEGVKSLAMQGKLPHSLALPNGEKGAAAAGMLEKARDLQTQTVLRQAAGLLEAMGIEVMDARTYLGPVLCPVGVIAGREPDERERLDIEFGRGVLNKIGSADIGQMVAVKNRMVLAVEAVEGTDEAVRRAASLGGDGAVIVKMAKPGQDMRFDLPVIGERTLRVAADCKASAVAVEAGKTVLLNKNAVIGLADKHSVAIVGIQ
jgi:UDP-2,3-diacylglucosamine hydrolase